MSAQAAPVKAADSAAVDEPAELPAQCISSMRVAVGLLALVALVASLYLARGFTYPSLAARISSQRLGSSGFS